MKVLKTVFWTVTVIICLTIVAGNFAEFQLNSYEDVTPTELLVLQKLEGEELDVCTGDYSLVDMISVPRSTVVISGSGSTSAKIW